MLFKPADPLPRTKICGITNGGDAMVAVDAGADAIGVNVYPGSKRCVDARAAVDWLRDLGGRVARVVVVVNPRADEVASLAGLGVFDAIQFHGDETPEFCAASGFPLWIKAVRVQSPADLEMATKYDTPYLLLDAWAPGSYGGTGVRVDWDLVRDFVDAQEDRRVLLAGGLTPQNVRAAVRIVRPFAVDVASGVELSPGVKDEYLTGEFLRQAKLAGRQSPGRPGTP